MNAKTLFPAAALFSMTALANAAPTAPAEFTLSFGANLTGGTNAWQSATGGNAAKIQGTLGWNGVQSDTITDYVASSPALTGAGFSQGSATDNVIRFRNQYGTAGLLPTVAGSNTWLVSTTINGQTRSVTSADDLRYVSFSLKAGDLGATVTGLTWDFLGAFAGTGVRSFYTNAYYSVAGGGFAKLGDANDWALTEVAQDTSRTISAGIASLTTPLSIAAGQTAEFRIMLDSNWATNNTLVGLKNISLTGYAGAMPAPIPEPSTYALFGGFAAAGTALAARRRKQK